MNCPQDRLHSPEVDPLYEPMMAIRRHHLFDGAAIAYIDNVIVWRRRLGLFNRVGTNLGFHVINYVVYLHYAAQRGQVEHGATFSQVLRICEARGNCGSRALRSVLTVLMVLKRLKSEQAQSDGRVQVFVPSETLMREVREVYGFSLGVLDSLLPGSSYAHLMQHDPNFIAKVITGSGRAIIEDDVRITEEVPALHEVISMAGGLPTSISLAAACMRTQSCPSTQQIATDFKISRTQVRNVIAAVAGHGLVERDGTGALIDAAPLVEAHKVLIARELALHFKCGLNLDIAQLE